MLISELLFGPIRDEGPEDSELLSDKGGDVEELSMGSTLTRHDTDVVVVSFNGGICIVIIIMGLIDDVSKFSSRPEWLVVDELVGPDWLLVVVAWVELLVTKGDRIGRVP